MAADVISSAGVGVILADQMPTVGRKFLMAGKSGLNITKDEPLDRFLSAYGPVDPAFLKAVEACGPVQVQRWAASLKEPIFTGSSGRVFPKAMKASPLLRKWLAKLARQGVQFRTRWRWSGWSGAVANFDTPDGHQQVTADTTVLALGGASWSRLGPDGAWSAHFDGQTAAFKPANMGFEVPWTSHMQPHFGSAVKGCVLRAGNVESHGEFVISRRGIEGGGVYEVAAQVRDGAALFVDLAPKLTAAEVAARLGSAGSKHSLSNLLRKSFRLDAAKRALFMEFGRSIPDVAVALKNLPFPKLAPRPMDEAISTAGGLRLSAMSHSLELNDRPGVFCAGEMLDWEAPTGGYLITGCLATGLLAGQSALRYLQTS